VRSVGYAAGSVAFLAYPHLTDDDDDDLSRAVGIARLVEHWRLAGFSEASPGLMILRVRDRFLAGY